MKEPIISFKNYSFQYRIQANPTLYDINLDIYPGEKILIAGPSGSGKSTLGNCLNGLIPHSYIGTVSGSLTVDGIDASSSSIFELSSHIGTVLQDPDGQFIGLTVGEDIAFALENHCVEKDEMVKTVNEAASLVGIESHLTMAPHELSGGQKQRVSLAGIMVDKVKILLFDEPLANLDPATGKSAIELIDEVQKKTDTTVVIIEHRLEDVLYKHVDRIILMDEGRIIADMTPNQLLCSPLLSQYGIREPLYLTACKFAGVEITEEKQPEHINSLVINQNDSKKINDWFESVNRTVVENNNDPILQIKDLNFGYEVDQQILYDINISIKEGEMLSIVGENGAGKSTLSKLICGFEQPDSGRIYYQGKDITDSTIRERAASIGYVMQNPNQMISKAMIYEEVSLGIRDLGLSEEEMHRRVDETLKICGLYEFRNWPISALSFGQKKRVTIASVLIMGPKLIILDEPTAGQDFKHYTDIMEFLRSLNDKGVTVVLITHDMHLMLEYTPRAIVFANGHIIADEKASQVLCDSQLVKQAALKETSLFALANKVNISDPVEFVDCFIDCDRKERDHGC